MLAWFQDRLLKCTVGYTVFIHGCNFSGCQRILLVRLRVTLPVCEVTCIIIDVVLTVNYAPVYSRVWFPDRLLKCRVRYTVFLSRFHVALRPRRRDGLLGKGQSGKGTTE